MPRRKLNAGRERVENEENGKQAQSGNQLDSIGYWLDKIRSYEAIFSERHWNAAKEAFDEYQLGEGTGGKATEAGTGVAIEYAKLFPIYWSSVKTLAPAYYSKTPIPLAPARYGIKDEVARTGSTIMERLGIYTMEVTPFDEVMECSTINFINADMASNRVMLEGEREKIPLRKGEDDQYYISRENEDGEEAEPELYDGEEVDEDDEGNLYGQGGFIKKKCYPIALSYDDMMWTPGASCEDEIEEEMFRFCYSEEDAYKEFPKIDRDELKGAMRVYSRKDNPQDPKHKKEKSEGKALFLHGWEIWCVKDKKIRFVSPDYGSGILKTEEDKYGLRKFYPATCPIVGTQQRGTLFAVPAIRYLKPLIEQLHSVESRIFRLARSIRRRFIVDEELREDMSDLIEDADDNEYLFVKNMVDIVEKGGIANLVQVLPVGELSQALVELSGIFEKFKNEFNEIYGIPDVIRGASDPLEGVGTQQIKNFAATNRFRFQMNQIARLARDTLELLIDLKLKAYDGQQIARIVGAQYMEKGDQERFPQALQLIMDDEERLIRIDLETDSTSYVNEMIEQQNRNVAIQTVTQGLQAINGMPPMQQAIGFKTIQSALAGLRLGKDYMDDIDTLMEQMVEAAKNPPQPPPDVQMLKVQMEGQKLQLKKYELDQRAQREQMTAMLNQKLEQFKLMVSAQSDAARNAVAMREQDRKDFEARIKAQKMEHDSVLEKVSFALESALAKFGMEAESMRIVLEQVESDARITERMMEELRLAKQQETDALKTAIDIIQAGRNGEGETLPRTIEMTPPAFNINVEGAKPGKKRGKMTRADGTEVIFEAEDVLE